MTFTVTSTKNTPRIILGAMTFGLETSDISQTAVRIQGAPAVKKFLDVFKSHGHDEIDTARMYTDSEAVLGQLDLSDFKVATKAFPFTPQSHTKENLKATFEAALADLKANSVDIFYLHAPDNTVPREETLQAINELYQQGKFKEFGLSNFNVREIEEVVTICKTKGYIMPTVYQGMYSPIVRGDYLVHRDVLAKYNIRFYSYGALASGLLTGKHKFGTEVDKNSRFHASSGFSGMFNGVYWHQEVFDALAVLTKATEEAGIPLAQASNRWMVHHSGLTERDGILVGVSSLSQLEQNLKDFELGPLPQSVLDAFEKAWSVVQHKTIAIVPSALEKPEDVNEE
ncbi:hypothetical protein BGW41_002725 [Actinomortierella wolfii]|nr:hypothetical protein BGW41_002725 [Actinomortierella wolfii]